jgi:hypothetical protein
VTMEVVSYGDHILALAATFALAAVGGFLIGCAVGAMRSSKKNWLEGYGCGAKDQQEHNHRVKTWIAGQRCIQAPDPVPPEVAREIMLREMEGKP